ncbi:OLC1v1022671C1 [Oldenlandia corymbosa var. corymbosa]|nr:OLC1v1022671C1 [Oldenlandia corymbosa var. corymbosa]
MAYALFDENLYLMNERELKDQKLGSGPEESNASKENIIPTTAIIRQLAVAVEAGKNYTSMRDLLTSSRDSSPVRERAAMSFSAMKSLMLREKDEKFITEFGSDEKVVSLIKSLVDAEGQFCWRNGDSEPGEHTVVPSLTKDIHGAPPESFVVKLSEAVGSLKTLRKMASLWCRVVVELRRLWSEGQYVPGIPQDEFPDLNCCLLYQQLQVINCCISRKKRRTLATESLESSLEEATLKVNDCGVSESMVPIDSILYARISSGELLVRSGANVKFGDMTMLETGEPVFTPVMQEAPLLTEDLIKETEEFVLRTGSFGAGCSQLLSDMQAFKAANPGCILEDFVRWHSPPDWMESEASNEADDTSGGGDLSSTRGQLSRRMQKEGNLWRELWETAKPIPAMRQTPLYDEDFAVEGILNVLADISPSVLFEQLFISLLGSGFVIAEAVLSTNIDLSKLFRECKDYIVVTCQSETWLEKVDELCQVYESVEAMLLNPDEATRGTVHPEETAPGSDLKNHFKRLNFVFGSKDKNSGKSPQNNQKNVEDNPTRQSFSSLFSRKPPKPSTGSPADKATMSLENGWTII